MDDLISRQVAIDSLTEIIMNLKNVYGDMGSAVNGARECIKSLPSAEPEIIKCKDCKHWKQQINYQGTPLPFGFCESEDIWFSLYGETTEVEHIDTDDNHYCGFAVRRTDG